MKKFIAGLLAFTCAIAIWFIPAGLILIIFKPIAESGGALIYAIFIAAVAYPLKYMIKSFYRYFLQKIDNFGDIEIHQNFTYENIDMSHFSKYKPNSKNSNHKEQKSSQNSQNHINNILQSKRDK